MTKLFKRTSLAALALVMAAQAVAGNEYDALIKAKKYPEAERAASARLIKEPRNAEAMIGKVGAIIAADAENRAGEAVALAEQCIGVNPDNARCHLALGKALGWKALTGGAMTALGDVRTMRDAYKKAVELDPRNLDARFSLMMFYMIAPRLIGGGIGKAETLAAETAALNPEAGKVMTGILDLVAERLPKAEAGAMSMRPSADDKLGERQEALLVGVANKYFEDKKYRDAERLLREAVKRFPDSDAAPYLNARVQQAQGKHREALAVLEPLLAKDAQARVHYRMGQSLQALGEKAKAVSAFKSALALKKGLLLDEMTDAETQIAALKR